MTAQRRQPLLGHIRRVHMVGIGGIGMSSIARVLLDRGYEVTGSDLSKSEVTAALEAAGATVFEGHAASQIGGADVVVHSSAVIPAENAETCAAAASRIPIIPRSEMLGELMRMKFGVGVAGTHGKTTTTSMVGLVIAEGGFDPTIIVGGKVSALGSNARTGEGDIIVIEADEYDRTFLRLTPSLAVVTSIEVEHTDTYRNLEDARDAFREFANSVPFFGAAIVCLDDAGVQQIVGGIERRLITYGAVRQAMVRGHNLRQRGPVMHFEVSRNRRALGEVAVAAVGAHNMSNALAAVTVGLELKIPFARIQAGLARFTGVHRRFQTIGEARGIVVIDDYAHHPTEVEATLQAASDGFPGRRIVAVFQPHLYSRTHDLKETFACAFFNADVAIFTRIYAAREAPRKEVSGHLLAELARQRGHRAVHYEPDHRALPVLLMERCREGDVVIFLGAGDIWRIARAFLKALRS